MASMLASPIFDGWHPRNNFVDIASGKPVVEAPQPSRVMDKFGQDGAILARPQLRLTSSDALPNVELIMSWVNDSIMRIGAAFERRLEPRPAALELNESCS
jgi:hypothetical protein